MYHAGTDDWTFFMDSQLGYGCTEFGAIYRKSCMHFRRKIIEIRNVPETIHSDLKTTLI